MPADAFMPLESVPSLDTIEAEVRAGLPGDAQRLQCAYDNEQFYRLRNEAYIERREAEDETSFAERPKLTADLTRAVVRKLGNPLYKPGPTRLWQGHAAADAFLQKFWQDAAINARMQAANRAAILND